MKEQFAFQIERADNVCTTLSDVNRERCILRDKPNPSDHHRFFQKWLKGTKLRCGASRRSMAVIKYGVEIGIATQMIEPGEWVHLHNCKSKYDERSSTLDLETGAPTDTPYL